MINNNTSLKHRILWRDKLPDNPIFENDIWIFKWSKYGLILWDIFSQARVTVTNREEDPCFSGLFSIQNNLAAIRQKTSAEQTIRETTVSSTTIQGPLDGEY